MVVVLTIQIHKLNKLNTRLAYANRVFVLKKEPKEVPLVLNFILIENQIQATSASPCRTQVQPAASFLVCSLIFIEY